MDNDFDETSTMRVGDSDFDLLDRALVAITDFRYYLLPMLLAVVVCGTTWHCISPVEPSHCAVDTLSRFVTDFANDAHILSFPSDVNSTVHRLLLHNLGRLELLDQLNQSQSTVNSSVKATEKGLNDLLCALINFPHRAVGDTYAQPQVQLVIAPFQKQLDQLVSNVNNLHLSYRRVEDVYDDHSRTVAKRLEKSKPTLWQEVQMKTQSWVLGQLGINYTQMYLAPYRKNQAHFQEVQSCLLLLQKEQQRVMDIKRMGDKMGQGITKFHKNWRRRHIRSRNLWEWLLSSILGFRGPLKGGRIDAWWTDWLWRRLVTTWLREDVASYLDDGRGRLDECQADEVWAGLEFWCINQ